MMVFYMRVNKTIIALALSGVTLAHAYTALCKVKFEWDSVSIVETQGAGDNGNAGPRVLIRRVETPAFTALWKRQNNAFEVASDKTPQAGRAGRYA